MNEEINKILNAYSIGTHFKTDVVLLIEELKDRLKRTSPPNKRLIGHYECTNLFHNTVRSEVIPKQLKIKFNDGYGGYNATDITFVYVVSGGYKMRVMIQIVDDNSTIGRAYLEIDDWLRFVAVDYTGTVGYYRNCTFSVFERCHEEHAIAFRRQYDSDLTTDSQTFFKRVAHSLFDELCSEFNIEFNDPYCIWGYDDDDAKSEDTLEQCSRLERALYDAYDMAVTEQLTNKKT